MEMFKRFGIDPNKAAIDWDLTPVDTFGMFESWGGKEKVRSRKERFYYFYIDSGAEPARLCLMERGIKHAKILAKIEAPQEMIARCIAEQGKTVTLDTSYAINDEIRQWLKDEVIEHDKGGKIIPLVQGPAEDLGKTGLPDRQASIPRMERIILRHATGLYSEDAIPELVRQGNFYDAHYNPQGYFRNNLVDSNDGLTVTDMVTNLMWQLGGHDINSIKTIQAWIEDLNAVEFAGYGDWRLPTIEEALSLVEKKKNEKGLFLHPCFSMAQPFIFTADRRKPGGYWLVDFTKGGVFWASGFNPGGFGRVCRRD